MNCLERSSSWAEFWCWPVSPPFAMTSTMRSPRPHLLRNHYRPNPQRYDHRRWTNGDPMTTPIRRFGIVLVTTLLMLTAACSDGDDDSETDIVDEVTTTEASESDEDAGIYLSLGDSYATGDGASDPS